MKKITVILLSFLLCFSIGAMPAFAQEEEEGKTIVFDDCDIGNNMFAQYVDTYNMIQGEGCVATNYWGVVTYHMPVDFSSIPEEDAYLEFYLYIDDLNLISGIFVSFNSSCMPIRNPDNQANDERHAENEFYWDISGYDYRRGWNYVSLKISDAEIAYGAPNFSAITQFRMVVWRPSSLEQSGLTSYLKLDYISVTDTPKTVSEEVLAAADVDKRSTVPQKISSNLEMMYDKGILNNTVLIYIITGCVALVSIAAVVTIVLLDKKRRKGNDKKD